MPAFKVLLYPHKALRVRSAPAADFGEWARNLCGDLAATMYSYDSAVGIAAPQVGIPVRLFVLNCRTELSSDQKNIKLIEGEGADARPLVFVNPEITWLSKDKERGVEGCLSFPGVKLSVERHIGLRLTARDADGQAFEAEANGLLARPVQHELDHLEGKLLIDYAPYYKRTMIKKRLAKRGE